MSTHLSAGAGEGEHELHPRTVPLMPAPMSKHTRGTSPCGRLARTKPFSNTSLQSQSGLALRTPKGRLAGVTGTPGCSNAAVNQTLTVLFKYKHIESVLFV